MFLCEFLGGIHSKICYKLTSKFHYQAKFAW